jgi:hypothetical protein
MKAIVRWLALVTLAAMLASCGDGGAGSPVAPTIEDWSYPVGGASKALALVTSRDTVRVGDRFEVKAVAYNITGLYGSTVKLEYDRARVQVEQVLGGPDCFGPAPIFVGQTSATDGIVSFGATRTDTTGLFSGSGVLFKLKCRAIGAGESRFRIRAHDLALVDREGRSLPDLSSLRQSDTSIRITP